MRVRPEGRGDGEGGLGVGGRHWRVKGPKGMVFLFVFLGGSAGWYMYLGVLRMDGGVWMETMV